MRTFIFFLFLSSISFGRTIQGVVFDSKTNRPISQAHIYIANIDKGTTTNSNGKFILKLSQISAFDSVYISHIGYKKKTILYHEKKKSYKIYLESLRNELGEVQLKTVKKQLNQRIRYNKLTSMKKGLYSFGSLLEDDKIYVVSGNITVKQDNKKRAFQEIQPENTFSDFIKVLNRKSNFLKEFYADDLLVYDLKLDVWESAEVKFRKRAHHNLHYYNNKLYVLGGKNLSIGRKYEYLDGKIEVYDNENNTLEVDDTNPHQAIDFASFSYDDKIIVMGGTIEEGKSGKKVYTDKVHLYDLKSGFWYELSSMPSAKEANGVLIDNTVYLIGSANEGAISSIESYDLVNDQWKKEGDLFENFTRPAVTYGGSVLYVFEDKKMVTYHTKTKELNEYLQIFLVLI